MSATSPIEWTNATWNPVRGCSKISPGCKYCYAEAIAERFRGVPGSPFEQGFDLRLVPDLLNAPLRWLKPKLVFVNSMSDLFHEGVPDEFIIDVCRVMETANWHTYQVLTKRSERMRDLLAGPLHFAAELPHVWWGVSVEDRQYGLPRLAHLKEAPARVRFVSIEPLLEELGAVDFAGIDWVIVGGESGANARPLHVEWVHPLIRQAWNADAAVFVKQLGTNPVLLEWPLHPRDRKGGEPEEWPKGLRYREYPPRHVANLPTVAVRKKLSEQGQALVEKWRSLTSTRLQASHTS